MPALDALLTRAAWTLWVTEPGPKKLLKVPVHYDGATKHSLKTPAPLLTHALAMQWLEYLRNTGQRGANPAAVGYVGLGFRPQPGIGCLDLDNCVDPATGAWSPAAVMVRDLILPGAAIELSVSGRGLHFWFRYTDAGHGIKHIKDHPQLGDFDLFQGDAAFVAIGTYLGGDADTDCTAGVAMLAAMAWPDDGQRTEHATPDDWATLSPEQRAATVEELRAALAHVSDAGNARWIKVMNALKSIGEDGRQLWFDWSRGELPGQVNWSGERAPDEHLEWQWARPYAGKVRRETVFHLAQEAGWVNRRRVDPETVFTPPAVTPTGAAQPGPGTMPAPTGTWDGLSSMTATKFGGQATLVALYEELNECAPLFRVAHDQFRDRTMLGVQGQWRQLRDQDVTWMRRMLLARGFKKVGKEDIVDVIAEHAAHACFDSAMMWADTLKWDGVRRIETSMSRYFGTEDSHYARTVGLYLFTALAGRLYSPGCQADMAVILISEAQGRRKSSCIKALVPDIEAYSTVDFGQDDKELAMRVRGRLVVEIPEMVGWNKRAVAHIRDWMTRTHEQWRGMHSNDVTTYPRRFVVMGTGNDKAILDDPTGARRWLPIEVTRTGDHEALAADRDQLWAEGIALWRQAGIQWQGAMEAAPAIHEEFSVGDDPWESYIEEWLDAKPPFGEATSNGSRPFNTADVLHGALQIRKGDVSKSDEMRASKVLAKLGYTKQQRRIGGKKTRWWSR